ncbi:ESPR-type extended signal peptide-containing protein [uncultured Dialister sp.]|uniref:ESPR-type extended signal peptide-containing protein n=1 Tax=uncultured Dialister sp. TaxID=278064 RepID=UPI002595C022|nr:ESPR-type extended signal peptide-containing protein [uncultured Dialister sp.]
MNRVYKVIWSKAKHCYVVTSEIARSVTKSASSARSAGRKGAAVLAMAALLFTAGGVLGEAANVTKIAVNEPGNVITATKDDGNTDTITINNVDNAAHAKEADYATAATKAYSDGNGLTFEKNYAKIADVEKDYVKKTDAQVTNLTASGKVTAGTLNAADGKFSVGSDGQLSVSNGSFKVDTNGGINIGNGTATIDNNGNITGKKLDVGTGDIKGGKITGAELDVSTGDIKGGQITGTGLNVGAGTIKTTGAVETGTLKTDGNAEIGGTLKAGATTVASLDAGSGLIKTTGGISGTNITGDNVEVNNKLTTKDMEVRGEFKVSGEFKTEHITLGSKPDNYTEIDSGNVTSEVNDTDGGVKYTAESIFNKDGSSITARTDEGIVDSTGKSIVGAKGISQYLGDNAKPDGSQKNVTRKMIRNNDGTFSMEDKAVYDGKSSTVSQNAKEGIVSETNGGAGSKVTLTQGMNGTYKVETSGTSTEEISGQKIENYKGGLDTNITGNETHDVSGNMTTTVTGDSSLTAENITNEAKNKITNKAIDVETDATSSIVQKVTNDAGSNTSTQWSYQTKEEMSQTDGKTASYLRGAVEEKSELIDGDVKTTIDTIAGQTNTNITDGTNTSNDLQKADQIASSVTNGTNKTVVNQDARSLASSITDGTGTKVNNSIHWVDGSAQRIEVDDTHFYAETRTAEKAEEALKSGNTVIDIVKDTNTATVSSAVTDGATITGISQNAKDISLSAAGGTITNDAKDVLNKGTNSVINEVGANQVAVMTDSVKAAYGSDTYTTWDGNGITSNTSGNMSNTVGGKMLNNVTGDMENEVGGDLINTVTGDSSLSAKNITNTATVKLSNSAAEIENSASTSITDKVGENVERTMGTKKIEESVKDGTKSNTFTKTAKKDMNIITDGTNTSTLSQLADKVNTSLKEVDGAGNTTKSLNNVKTVSEDTTKMTDAASGEFSKRSQTVSQIQDKVGKTTVTTTDGLTKLTDEDHNHTTEMDYAHVTKDLSVERNTTLGKEGEGTTLTVNSTSTFKDTVKMEKTLEVDGESTFNDKVTIKKNGLAVTGGTTTDTLNVTGETRTGTLHVNGNGYVGGDLNVEGNIETHDAVLSADSRQVVTGRQLYQTNERVDRLDNRIKKVGANAAALAALRPGDFNPDDKFSIAAGFGSYRNANAAALGLFYRPNENVLLSLGTSFGDGENMVNAGVSVKFGRGKSMAERRKEMADEVSSMRDEMRSQDERIAELEEMLKKQSELIEKLSKES